MKRTINDEDVIRDQFRSQPNACFETLYNRYVTKVYNRCYSMTRDSEKAQDFTHDIFIRAFERLDRFEERSTFSTWLYAISYNYCIDQIRLSKRIETSTLSDELTYQHVGNEAGEELESELQQLSRVMSLIPSSEAKLLRMKYQQGLEVQQIATKLGLGQSAVKMRLKRSRDKVRELFDAYSSATCSTC